MVHIILPRQALTHPATSPTLNNEYLASLQPYFTIIEYNPEVAWLTWLNMSNTEEFYPEKYIVRCVRWFFNMFK